MTEQPAPGSGPRLIALFPLNVVLFPGMRLPLHIFEERYRLMIVRWLDGELEFGVTLIRSGAEVGAPAEPFDVGTLVRLVDVARFPDGRFNLLTEGTQRFRLLELTAQVPYLQGVVEILPENTPPLDQVADVVANVAVLFRRYVDTLFRLAGREPANLAIADQPRDLSYQVASTLQIDRLEKQQLLEIDSVEERLREELAILRNQNEALDRLLRERQSQSGREGRGTPPHRFRFSDN